MKLLIQRVHHATITIDHDLQRSIGQGLIVYIGLSTQAHEQYLQKTEKALSRLVNMKIFGDEQGRLKRSLTDIQGDILLVSNFTLHGKNKKGTQVDFSDSAGFEQAKELYDHFVDEARKTYTAGSIQTGEFGAYMEVQSSSDGPVNMILDF